MLQHSVPIGMVGVLAECGGYKVGQKGVVSAL